MRLQRLNANGSPTPCRAAMRLDDHLALNLPCPWNRGCMVGFAPGELLNDREGVWRCRTIFNCTEACPREIKITKAIGEVKKAILYGSARA